MCVFHHHSCVWRNSPTKKQDLKHTKKNSVKGKHGPPSIPQKLLLSNNLAPLLTLTAHISDQSLITHPPSPTVVSHSPFQLLLFFISNKLLTTFRKHTSRTYAPLPPTFHCSFHPLHSSLTSPLRSIKAQRKIK